MGTLHVRTDDLEAAHVVAAQAPTYLLEVAAAFAQAVDSAARACGCPEAAAYLTELSIRWTGVLQQMASEMQVVADDLNMAAAAYSAEEAAVAGAIAKMEAAG